jgi:hypothetical protein
MEKQMLAELEVRCPFVDVVPGIHKAFSEAKGSGDYELEVPFERIGLPHIGTFSRRARVMLGETKTRSDGATLIPVRWRDASSNNFPEFDGYIEIIPLGADLTQLAIIGDYVPPFGPVGAIFDAAVGRRIAEVTVEELLVNLRTALERRT